MTSLSVKVKCYLFFATNYMPLYRCCLLSVLICFLISSKASSQSVQQKVVMISVDGAPDYLIDKFLSNGVLPSNGAFARMRKKGAYAESLLPVNVASTGPSHISVFTGASPGKTGIVGNNFRKSDQNWTSPALSAFRHPIAAETIFKAAMRQGKKVMALGGVGLDYSTDSRMTDYLHMYPVGSGPSLVIDLILTDTFFNNEAGKGFVKLKVAGKSPSQAIFEISGSFKIPFYIYLADSAHNDPSILRPLTQMIIDTDSDLNNGYAALVIPDTWTGMAIEKNGKQFNTSFRIFNVDATAGKYRLFMTAPAEVFGYPSGFLQKLQSKCGLWPGEPENRKQTAGLVSEEIWFEQIDRLAKYSRDLILTGMKEGSWDLLFGYFSTLDDVQHRYTLINSRQLDYKADNGNRPKIYAAYIEKWFQVIDAYLLEIMNAAAKETNFVIFSDHGMIPIHTRLLLNNYFKQAGFAFSKQELTSLSSGTSSHIYINKEKLSSGDYVNYLNRLKRALISFKDLSTGESIFELVADQEEQKKYGLFHEDYSGDLFVSCKPGYAISDRYLSGVNYLVQNSFDPAIFGNQNQATKNFLLNGTMNETGRGVHGCLATVREGQSIFYAIGPDVPQKKVKKMFSLQIASTVSTLLGIQPPKDTEAKSIF